MVAFCAQAITMGAVMTGVHNTVAGNPLRVMALQAVIGAAWCVNVSCITNGSRLAKVCYVLGGMVGAAIGTEVGGRWH